MTEDIQENRGHLVRGLARAYVLIRRAYASLPQPITLPRWDDENDLQSVHVAILNAAQEVRGLTVEKETKSALIQASMHWASATVLTIDYVDSELATVGAMADWNMETAAVFANLAVTRLRRS